MPADPNRVRDVFLAASNSHPNSGPATWPRLAEAMPTCGPRSIDCWPQTPTPTASSNPLPAIRAPPSLRRQTFRRYQAFDIRTVPTPHESSGATEVTPSSDRTEAPRPLAQPDPDATTAAESERPRPAASAPDGRRDRHRHRRPVHAGRGDRRGGHGLGVSGQPDRAGQASGGAQADQDGDGFAGRAGPVRRRAAGPGADGPPEHRPHLRRRPHPGRPAVLRHGAGARACRSPSTATSSGCR